MIDWMIATMALGMVLGHFVLGVPLFYRPLQKSSLEIYVKSTFTCAFHFLSLFLGLKAIIFIAAAMGKLQLGEDLYTFLMAQNFFFAVVIAFTLWKSQVRPYFVKVYPAYSYLLMTVLIFLQTNKSI